MRRSRICISRSMSRLTPTMICTFAIQAATAFVKWIARPASSRRWWAPGQHGFNGDGPALEVNLTWPAAIAFDADDVLYIADTQAHRVRRFDPETGQVTTIAGNWSEEDEAREQPLVARNLVVLSGDAIGIDFSDDQGWLMPVCSDGLDLSMYLDDGRPALEARLYDIVGITVDNHGHVCVVDKGSNRVRKIDKDTGIISTIAGVCRFGYDGDGKPAVKSMLHAPEAVLFDERITPTFRTR